MGPLFKLVDCRSSACTHELKSPLVSPPGGALVDLSCILCLKYIGECCIRLGRMGPLWRPTYDAIREEFIPFHFSDEDMFF